MTNKNVVVGVDLGGTKIYTALANDKGDILSEIKLPTESFKSQALVFENIFQSIQSCLEQAKLNKENIRCIGVGVPGPVNYKEGILNIAPNIPGWINVNIREHLQKRFNTEIRVANDAHLAALSEMTFGAGKGYKHLIYITVSTGIGSCLVIDDNIYLGKDGAAGEIGQTLVKTLNDKNELEIISFEKLTSGTAIRKKFGFAAKELLERMKQQDAKAHEAVDFLVENLSFGFANLTTLLNPELIIIGGGLSCLGDILFAPLRQKIKERSFSKSAETVKIVEPALKQRSGVLGAVALCFSDLKLGENILCPPCLKTLFGKIY